jgi:hypothetical protein
MEVHSQITKISMDRGMDRVYQTLLTNPKGFYIEITMF